MSHLDYFTNRKNIRLEYPDEMPMVAVMGRRNETIYLPPELVTGNELDASVREQLPQIASFKPDRRNAAIEKMKSYLIPGAQTSPGASGLLPAIGVVLHTERLSCQAEVMAVPALVAAGVRIPERNRDHWAPLLSKAVFNIGPSQSVNMNVIVVVNSKIKQSANAVYGKIRDIVNGHKAHYRFGQNPYAVVEAGDNQQHWGAVEKYFSQSLPANIFVLDFCKSKSGSDPAYPVIKHMLCKSGHLSQFVNFNTYSHDNPRDERKSSMILQGVARQCLQKAGVSTIVALSHPEELCCFVLCRFTLCCHCCCCTHTHTRTHTYFHFLCALLGPLVVCVDPSRPILASYLCRCRCVPCSCCV
jgi:hypothetical protein